MTKWHMSINSSERHLDYSQYSLSYCSVIKSAVGPYSVHLVKTLIKRIIFSYGNNYIPRSGHDIYDIQSALHNVLVCGTYN